VRGHSCPSISGAFAAAFNAARSTATVGGSLRLGPRPCSRGDETVPPPWAALFRGCDGAGRGSYLNGASPPSRVRIASV